MSFMGAQVAALSGVPGVGKILGGISGQQSAGPVESAATGAQAKEAYMQQQAALDAQKSFVMALQQQGGIGNQTAVFQQQQQLAQQLQAQAMGQGPNPVQAQLAQATGANTANQAALMAGQRGASANAGMMARQAAMQGGANQQAMAGQAATLSAQQQLAAQQALMQQQGQMAGLSSQMVGQQQQALQTQGNMALQGQSNVLNALTNQNQMNVGIEQGNLARQNQLVGSILGAGGAAVGMMAGGGAGKAAGAAGAVGKAHGGMVKAEDRMQIKPQTIARPDNGWGAIIHKAHGGMVSPNSGPASHVGRYFMSQGGSVPGQASVAGDSMQNDTVPTMLSPGEIVIPRTVLQGKNPAEAAKKFVEAVLAREGNPAKK